MFESYNLPKDNDTLLLNQTGIQLMPYVHELKIDSFVDTSHFNHLTSTLLKTFSIIERLHLAESGLTYIEKKLNIVGVHDHIDVNCYSNKYGCGIIVARTAGTNTQDVFIAKSPKYMEAAAENLRQDSHHKLVLFTTEESNCLFVVTNKRLSYKTWIKLELLYWSLIKNRLPAFKEEIQNMLKALLNEDIIAYDKAFLNLINDPSMVDLKYNKILRTLNYKKTADIERLRTSISDLRNQINSYRNAICSGYKEIEDLGLRLEALENKEEKTEDKLIKKYFIKCPYISEVVAPNNHRLLLYYEAPLLYFDDYVLEKVIERKPDKEARILKLFQDSSIELMARCRISFDTYDFNINRAEFIGNSDTAISHPHIDQYACFGNHSALLTDPAENSDYLMAFEEITQAVLNINFTDGIVVNTMLQIIEENMNAPWWRNKETDERYSTKELLGE